MGGPADYLQGRVSMASGRFVTSVPLQVVSSSTLPAQDASNSAALLVVSDGAGGDPVLALSDGLDWRRVDTLFPVSATGPGGSEAGGDLDVTGITGSQILLNNIRATRHVQVNLTAATLNVTAANDFGGFQFVNLPDSNIIITAVETDLVLTKGDTVNGIRATTDLAVGVGTATAAANPPAGDAVNVIAAVTLTADALDVDFNRHTNDESGTIMTFVPDGPSNGLFLNVGAVGGITADDTVTLNGTVDIYYIDVGNVTS